ncbi:GILT-like protein F37H8.5, partial [Trichinella patagoniensis]
MLNYFGFYPLFVVVVVYNFFINESCNIPPALWCNSENVATECSVLDACLYYNTSQLDKKIKLTLLYETLCPDCQEFILNTLQRYVWKYGQDFVDFNLIPYGNARRTQLNNTWTIQCQHGPVECALNKLHGCAISKLVYVGKWFPLIVCLEEAAKLKMDPDAAFLLCSKKKKLDQTLSKAIYKCADSVEGAVLCATFGDGSGIHQRTTQWLPLLSMLTEKDDVTCWFARLEAFFKVARIPDCEKSTVVFMYVNETSHGLTHETDYNVLKDSLLNQLRVDANHFERRMELSRSTQTPEEYVESYSARIVSLSKQAFPTAGEEVQTQMAKDQLIRGVSNDRIRELLVPVEEKPLAEMVKLAGQEETVLNRMRSAISGATVVHVNDRLATGKQCVGVAKSGSTAATAEERAATALEEEQAEVSEGLAVSVDCRQNIEKLVNEFRRMLTRSLQLKQPRTRTANPPSQRLAEAVCWKCGSSSHYRRSCPFSKTRRERRSPSTTGEHKPTQKTSILSLNKKWAVKLSGEVNGRSLKLLVDTGAAISLIREAELNMASNVRISKYGSRQIVAANGERVETVGTAEVDINIGDKLLKRHLMIVARSLSHPCLLDIDFLRHRRALIDLGDNRIKLGEVWLKLESSKTQEDKNRGEAQQECDICLLETVTLPAQTEMIVTGSSDRTTPKLVNNYSVMAACSLSRAAGGTVPVRLLNGTDRLITLFKDTKLGTYSTAYTTTSAGCEKEPPRTEPMNKYSDLIDNMLQLPRNIPNDIRKQLRALLWKYKRVIATDNYDTGRTNICKHSINTGDTPPIKQNPRRIRE